MAPNNGVKGGLSHSAQKKENAAAKKDPAKKGPAGSAKEKPKSVICKICRATANNAKELKIHFDNKHPKETFDEATHAIVA